MDRTRNTWITVGLVLAVVATAVNGVVVGYGVLWFQLFGETADAEDYRVSAGGYGAAALVLVMAVPALLERSPRRWPAVFSGVVAGVLVLGAVSSALTAAGMVAEDTPVDTAWDGVGGVVWAPWTWALVALGLRSLIRRAVRAASRS